MSSFFFHQGDEAAAFIAPPPLEYIEMTHRRAMWQNFGLRVEEMTAEDYLSKIAMLQAEAERPKQKA